MKTIFEYVFNDTFFGKYLGRKIYNYILSKNLTLSQLEKQTGIKQPHMSTLLNGKRTTKNIEQYKVIALGAGMLENDFYELVAEARKAEYENSTGKEINKIENLNSILSREFGISDEDSIEDIKKFIKYTKEKNK